LLAGCKHYLHGNPLRRACSTKRTWHAVGIIYRSAARDKGT
jgi:hypothetical protein